MAATEFELLKELEDELEDEQEFEARPAFAWESYQFRRSVTEEESGLLAGCSTPTLTTVSGFLRYSNSVPQLGTEQAKLTHIRNLILQSLGPNCRPLLRVRLVGHADRDLVRERREPGFMARISRRRALAVKDSLERLINNRAISSRILWDIHGAGASQLVVPNPATELERRRNRRVDITISTGGAPPESWAIAVKANRRYRRSLGWQAYISAIMRLMGFATYRPTEAVFASAVARWQQLRGLAPNGIVGPQTLGRIRASLQSYQSIAARYMRPAESMQEIPPDPSVMRRLQREFPPEEADKFWTELVGGHPLGHKRLTELAASGLSITPRELNALKDGNARVDDWNKATVPAEQKRHTLRRFKCQPVPDALKEARDHLSDLHDKAMKAPPRSRMQFEWLGEALHLIQDSYSDAHTDRVAVAGGGLPITFIRFYGPGSCSAPREHGVPVDTRDCITVTWIPIGKVWVPCLPAGTLTVQAKEAISASRDYLVMALRHISSPGSPTIPAELLAFMDRHLILAPGFTPTTRFYPRCPDPDAPCSP